MLTHAPILYWLPKVQRIEDAPSTVAGRFRRRPSMVSRNVPGPAPGYGLLATTHHRSRLMYDPGRQTWHDLGGDVYIGVDRDWQPAHFAADRPMLGDAVTLGRHEWWLPVCNPDSETCHLPRVPFRFGQTYVQKIRSDYYGLAECAGSLASDLRRALLSQGVMETDTSLLYPLIAEALAVNYDLTEPELLALEILDDASTNLAVMTITGMDALLADARQLIGEASHGR